MVTAVRKAIGVDMRPPVSRGVAGGVSEGRLDRDRGDDRCCCGQHDRPPAGAPWTPHQQARTDQRQAHRGVDRHPPGHSVRPGDIGLHEQLIDAEIVAEGVLGEYQRAEDRVKQARGQRRPGVSPGQRDECDPGQHEGQRGIECHRILAAELQNGRGPHQPGHHHGQAHGDAQQAPRDGDRIRHQFAA